MTRSSLRNAALTCATRWQWPVVAGATATTATADSTQAAAASAPQAGPAASAGSEDLGRGPGGEPGNARGLVRSRAGDPPPVCRCSCADPDCAVPGAHPDDPVLLAATTDARMVRWWWTERPDASLVLATGTTADGRRSPCALSLPALAGVRALADFDGLGIRLGPVVATHTRFAFLVEPYELEELGDLLYAHDWVPSSLRFHGDGGYVALPPTPSGGGRLRWERGPVVDQGRHAPWLPRMEALLDTLVEASTATPDPGSRLAY